MNEKPKLVGQMTPQEMEELKKKQKACHRAFYCHAIMVDVPPAEPPSGLMTPHGPIPVEQPQRQAVSINAGFWPCQGEVCMMWDKRKQRCLDVSAAVTAAYGKNPPLSVDGSDT